MTNKTNPAPNLKRATKPVTPRGDTAKPKRGDLASAVRPAPNKGLPYLTR